jgi:CRISPR-associated protein Cas2
MATFVIYDTDDDRVRLRLSEACLDYGLERIQFSAFSGALSRNEREELVLRLKKHVTEGKEAAARIYVQPVCETDRAAGRQIVRGVLQASLPPEARRPKEPRGRQVKAVPEVAVQAVATSSESGGEDRERGDCGCGQDGEKTPREG